MNLQLVSEIFFEELYGVPAEPLSCGRSADAADAHDPVADPLEGDPTGPLVSAL